MCKLPNPSFVFITQCISQRPHKIVSTPKENQYLSFPIIRSKFFCQIINIFPHLLRYCLSLQQTEFSFRNKLSQTIPFSQPHATHFISIYSSQSHLSISNGINGQRNVKNAIRLISNPTYPVTVSLFYIYFHSFCSEELAAIILPFAISSR